MGTSTRTQPRRDESSLRKAATRSTSALPAATSLRTTALLSFLLALFTVPLYAPVQTHPFVNYDDDVYVTVNDHVKAGLTWQTFTWALTTYDAANWHPLTWLSHATDYQLFGDNPAGHHDHNLLLHAINAVLLFWVLLRATGYAGRSWMVAALFALHPINVETVVWIAERKNLLSMLLFLLALGAYQWYASAPREGNGQSRLLRYLTVVFLFALALMAKPQVITFPFVLLLWDYWPLERVAWVPRVWRSPDLGSRQAVPLTQVSKTAGPFGKLRAGSGALKVNREQRQVETRLLLLEKVPLLLMSAASALLTIASQRTGGGFNPDYTFLARSENAVVSYVRYIGKAFWPSHLAVMYPHPGSSLKLWQAGAALAILALISALAVSARQRRYLLVGWLWFLGTLVPMIGIVQVGRQAMADRYAYLSFIGLFIMVCWAVADWAEQHHVAKKWIAVPSCAVLLALAFVTHRQIGYWSDNITLWTHTLQVTTDNFQAEDDLGQALEKAGRIDEAIPHYVRASQINPSFPPAIMYLAVNDQRGGKLREAIAKYKEVIRDTDNASYQNAAMRSMAFGNMGDAYRELGELADARSSLQSAVALNQKSFQVWMDLGVVSQRLGDPAAAAHAYEQAVQIKPYDVGYLLLARTLEQLGQHDKAAQALQQAKVLTNNYERAQQKAAGLLGASN